MEKKEEEEKYEEEEEEEEEAGEEQLELDQADEKELDAVHQQSHESKDAEETIASVLDAVIDTVKDSMLELDVKSLNRNDTLDSAIDGETRIDTEPATVEADETLPNTSIISANILGDVVVVDRGDDEVLIDAKDAQTASLQERKPKRKGKRRRRLKRKKVPGDESADNARITSSINKMLDWAAAQRPKRKHKPRKRVLPPVVGLRGHPNEKGKEGSKPSHSPPNTAERRSRLQEPLRRLEDLKKKQMNERQYVLELTRSRLAKAKERLSSVSATSMHSSPALIRLQTFVDEADDEIFQRRIGKLQRQEASLFESPVHRDVTLRRHIFSRMTMGHCLASRALLVHQNLESQADQEGCIAHWYSVGAFRSFMEHTRRVPLRAHHHYKRKLSTTILETRAGRMSLQARMGTCYFRPVKDIFFFSPRKILNALALSEARAK